MKKTILRYGAYAGLFEFIAFVLTWLVIYLSNAGHEFQGYIGYVSIISPLIFIYFGIRYYRDRINNGSITFLEALKIGLLIVIIPAVSFAIVETVYVLYIDPKFYENIFLYDLAEYRKSLSPAEFAVKLKEMKQEIALNNNPLYNFTAMILYVGALGTIITLISSLLLMRKIKKGNSQIT